MEKVLKKIQESGYCKGIYLYMIIQEEVIPVLVVEEFSQNLVTLLQGVEIEGWIILTVQDIRRGGDVYGVIFNHIRFRSELIWGNDFLAQYPIDKSEMRNSVEFELRRVCIDLREAIILHQSLADLLPALMIQIDRIWYACGYLLDIRDINVTLSEIVYEIQEQWNIDHMSLYQTLHHGTGSVDLMVMHKQLLLLLGHIDILEESRTNNNNL